MPKATGIVEQGTVGRRCARKRLFEGGIIPAVWQLDVCFGVRMYTLDLLCVCQCPQFRLMLPFTSSSENMPHVLARRPGRIRRIIALKASMPAPHPPRFQAAAPIRCA